MVPDDHAWAWIRTRAGAHGMGRRRLGEEVGEFLSDRIQEGRMLLPCVPDKRRQADSQASVGGADHRLTLSALDITRYWDLPSVSTGIGLVYRQGHGGSHGLLQDIRPVLLGCLGCHRQTEAVEITPRRKSFPATKLPETGTVATHAHHKVVSSGTCNYTDTRYICQTARLPTPWKPSPCYTARHR